MPSDELKGRREWRARLVNDMELRACLRRIVESVSLEISPGDVQLALNMENAVADRIESQGVRLTEISDESGCIATILERLGTTPEDLKLKNIMEERRAGLILEKVDIEDALTRLPTELDRLKGIRVELERQLGNADFLGDILAELDAPVAPPTPDDPCVAPVPSGIDPDEGRASLPVRVTVSGRFFRDGASVRIDGRELTDVVVVTSVRLTGVIPAGLPVGRHSLIVVNSDGKSGKLEGAYFALD